MPILSEGDHHAPTQHLRALRQTVSLSTSQRAKLDELRAQESRRHREFMERDISTGGGYGDIPTY